MKRHGPGNNCSNPRQVTELVHAYNKGSRDGDDEKQEGIAGERLRIFTYDLQDFFTKVPREAFLKMLQESREEVRKENRKLNYF